MRDRPIVVQLVTATGCANCVKAQRAVAEPVDALRDEYPIELQELDLTEHPELLARHDVWGTPALIVDDEIAFVGNVDERQLRAKLAVVAAGR